MFSKKKKLQIVQFLLSFDSCNINSYSFNNCFNYLTKFGAYIYALLTFVLWIVACSLFAYPIIIRFEN